VNEVTNILRYISPSTSFVVNLEDYRSFITIAKLEERERIIKLLEEVLHFDSEDEKRNLFALITGDQK
jgi:hypothetical protein